MYGRIVKTRISARTPGCWKRQDHCIFSRENCKHQVNLAQERSYNLLRKQAGEKRLSKVIRAQMNLSLATNASHKVTGSIVLQDFSPALAQSFLLVLSLFLFEMAMFILCCWSLQVLKFFFYFTSSNHYMIALSL
jgi:hypothetical protein